MARVIPSVPSQAMNPPMNTDIKNKKEKKY